MLKLKSYQTGTFFKNGRFLISSPKKCTQKKSVPLDKKDEFLSVTKADFLSPKIKK